MYKNAESVIWYPWETIMWFLATTNFCSNFKNSEKGNEMKKQFVGE